MHWKQTDAVNTLISYLYQRLSLCLYLQNQFITSAWNEMKKVLKEKLARTGLVSPLS